eukprot:59998-Rhodomonas_salina.4
MEVSRMHPFALITATRLLFATARLRGLLDHSSGLLVQGSSEYANMPDSGRTRGHSVYGA